VSGKSICIDLQGIAERDVVARNNDILFEGKIHSYRQIFMNAKHPEDPDPTWYGHSVGHWEGNTLVVDTIGFNDKFWFDYKGHPHREKLHTVERYTRTASDIWPSRLLSTILTPT